MKKISSLVCFLLVLGFTRNLTAQNNVGIGIAAPDPTAVLHLDATDKGLLVPRMSTAQRTAIINPADGLLVYDNTLDCFYYFSTTTNGWVSLCQAGGGGGVTGPTGATGPAGPTGPTGSGGGGGNDFNTAVIFNPATDSLSVTDGGGTLSAYITQPGRWSAKGTTDINYTTAAIPPNNLHFAAMQGTTVTFTPTKSVVFISASAAGDLDITHQAASIVLVRIKDVTHNTEVIGSQCISGSTWTNVDQTTGLVTSVFFAAAWNVSMSTAYNVTPGVPITLDLEWTIGWGDVIPGQVNCNAASDPGSNRSIIVWE